MPAAINHVVVLVMENRSFDHMVGYMRTMYPAGQFDGLSGTESNPDGSGNAVTASDAATGVLPISPAHSHEGVCWQLTGNERFTPQDPIINTGFVRSYEKIIGGSGAGVMQCFSPARVPVLAALARGFTICDRWFCSVPGETWPNRNYFHAATSDGEPNINRRFYWNRTVFELLQDAGHDWAIYHQGPAQLWVFPRLWQSPFSRADRFRALDDLPNDIRGRRLPAYTFVEPDHGLLWPRQRSNSQHPSNNRESPRDFYAGERLLLDVYSALIDTPDLLEKTLFIVTYDEHGGYYEHVHPPRNTPPAIAPDDKTATFGFDLLGPRVPAILISPWIPAGIVDHTTFDHTAVPASLRERFAPGAPPLTKRDAASKTVWPILTLAQARTPADMPKPNELAEALDRVAQSATGAIAGVAVQPGELEPVLDEFQESLIELAVQVDMAVTTAPPGADAVAGESFTQIAALAATPLQRNAEARAAYLEGMERRFRNSGPPPLPAPDTR